MVVLILENEEFKNKLSALGLNIDDIDFKSELSGMAWNLDDLARRIRDYLWRRSKNFVFGWLKPEQMPEKQRIARRSLKRNEEYVEIRLKSMRIPFEQVLGRKYYGAVHSIISLDSWAVGTATFNTVTTPTELQRVDPTNVSNVIQRNIPLLGRFPYIGNDISVEAGVFSIIEQDLVAPFLKIIEEVSSAAGVDVVSKAIPFVQPIQNAIYSLIGYNGDNRLEIGIKMPLKETGCLVAVATEAPSDDYISKLSLNEDGRLFVDGKEIKEAYMVLTIEAYANRDNVARIPYLLKAHQDLQAGVRTGDKKTIMELFKVFKNQVNGSPDIILGDKTEVIEYCEKEWVKPYTGEIAVPETEILPAKTPPAKLPAKTPPAQTR